MSTDHVYNVELTWVADRKGIVASPELPLSFEVATPPDFPKGMPGIWSPEHLFIAAINSCLMTTFLAVAENSKLEFLQFSCSSTGKVDRVDGKFKVSEVTLRPHLVVSEGVTEERARRILEMSEKACLISNSVNSVIHFEPTVSYEEVVV
jgi:organic hydroperoxide reductase OsmC/OhrA